MPILDVNDNETYGTVEEKENQRVYRTQEDMKTSILFNKDHKLDTIIQYPKGSKWEVDYFLQVRDLNDTLAAPDINIPPTIQKYHRINKLIVYLQSPITQDSPENISGEALITAGFLVNQMDVFIAELAGGRQAVFIVTEVNNRTYNLGRAYLISFRIFMFSDTEPNIYNDLINKAVKEYVYDKEHLLDYSAPVILQQDYKKKLSLKDALEDIIDYYFTKFINLEKRVIAVPTTGGIYIDTMLDSFLFKIINTTDHVNIGKITRVDYLPDDSLRGCTIWDAIYNRDKSILKRAIKHIGFKYTPYFYNNIINRKMNVLGIKFIANKLDKEEQVTNVDNIVDLSIKPYPDDYKLPININSRSYVVSDDFYNLATTEYSGLLEELLMDYLNGRLIDVDKLQILIEQYIHWETIDQYYLIPLLMVLIKDGVNNTFKSL